jgi:integrase
MKMRRPHVVPLAPQVVELLKAQQLLTGGGRYLFPGRNNVHMPLSDAALGKGLKMLEFQSDVHTAHGTRSTASTLLNEMGWDSALIELQLAHQKSDKVAAVYDRAQRLPERRKMMVAWADYLDTLRAQYRKE